MPKMTYVKQLEAMSTRCANPDCTKEHDEVYLHSGCHIGAGVDVVYQKGTRFLHLACRACGKPVCDVAVAEESLMPSC